MIKATFKSKYRKAGTGNLVFVYTVSGTAKEVVAYISAVAKDRGITEDEVTKDEQSGLPLYYFTPSIEQGRIASKVKYLTISFGGKVVEDDSDSKMKEDAEDYLMMRQELSKLRAERVFRGDRAPITVTRTATPAATEKDDFESAIDDLQGEKIGEPKEPVAAGGDNLGD